MAANKYDVIVVGAGIQGSCTALHLVRTGKKVLLIEQFPLPHTRGSSHGQSRLIRSAYSEDFFTRMMADAFKLWKSLEAETEMELIWRTGLLLFARPPYHSLKSSHKNMTEMCPENISELDFNEAKKDFPMITFPKDTMLFVDKSGGVVKAGIALNTIQRLFSKYGGTIMDTSPITAIHPKSDVVEVEAGGKQFQGTSLVLCCGPWTNKVLNLLNLQLPLQPERVQVFYFKEKNPGQYSNQGGFPAFLCMNDTRAHCYGSPSIEYPGMVKVCVHCGVSCDPDNRDKSPATNEDRKMLKEFILTHFPDLEEEPAIVETCMYTVTPDESYILDYHPEHRNVIIGAGFSGSGFKISPLVGEILGQLATGEKPKHDLEPFCIKRFKTQKT